MHVLIVEDEAKTAETLALYLRDAGFEVTHAADGREGLRLARRLLPDLVLLDLMLPGLDGRELCRRLRESSRVPVLMLTARTTAEDRIEGLELGADDYLAKPFSPREVVLRVQAILRRTATRSEARRLAFDGLAVELSTHSVTVEGEPIEVTPTQYALLETFLAAPERVFSRAELIERAFGLGYEGDERTVDAHIKNLRRRIDTAEPSRIRTVFGVGYRLATRELP